MDKTKLFQIQIKIRILKDNNNLKRPRKMFPRSFINEKGGVND